MNLNNSIPLFVDLDGTIIKEDIGQMAIKKKIKDNIFNIFGILIRFMLFGKPSVKFYVSKNFDINFDKLHFNHACIEFIMESKKLGRKIFLISGSHESVVKIIGDKLNIFDGIYGTRKNYNMVSYNKVHFIHNTLGYSKFDYIGNSYQDLPVWNYSENVIYTNVEESLFQKINLISKNKIFIKHKFDKN